MQITMEHGTDIEKLQALARQRAEAIARDLEARAIPLPGGVVTWRAGADADAPHGAPRRALGVHLYDGTCGVAVFLAAWARVAGDAEAGDLARRAVAPLRLKLMEPSRPLAARPLALGGMLGLGSFVYALLLLAHWLERDEMWASARAAAALLTPARIDVAREADVVGGCAGALLALLGLESQPSLGPQERGRALDAAVACGRRLLALRAAQAGGPRAWPADGSPALSGFAHGAAGIGYALARLFERTGIGAYREAALEGFAFERSLYDARARTWLDPRSGRPLQQAAWCHGAPGIALGRAACAAILRDAALDADRDLALALARALPDARRDHLCCGNAGRIEALFSAGRVSARAELVDEALCLTRRRLESAAAPAERHPAAHRDDEALGLFSGVAGLGYTLLRLLHPERLPCVLLLEPPRPC